MSFRFRGASRAIAMRCSFVLVLVVVVAVYSSTRGAKGEGGYVLPVVSEDNAPLTLLLHIKIGKPRTTRYKLAAQTKKKKKMKPAKRPRR